MDYKFLSKIKTPNDIKNLNNNEINLLCAEIRDYMIETVSHNGGHLASNLGAVELTVALHLCFNSPEDTIIFDVGHQCYAHKLLTGRYKAFSTLRKENGISGFMKPEESEHDSFITGHSSTSVSSAYGVCKANELLHKNNYSVAVLGDGALTGGMVYEAFNNVKRKDRNLIVVLNDNKMSISKNRGALSNHLSSIRTQKHYFKFKSRFDKFLLKIPFVGKFLRSIVFHTKSMIKNALYHSNIFESLGFYYMGPVDGHDTEKLCEMIEVAKEYNRPVLIHVKTVKGKGYAPAEKNAGAYHGVSSFDRNEGYIDCKNDNFSSVFGKSLCELAEKDDSICAVTAAMKYGTGLQFFSSKFGDRFFDVGIAEEHAVTFSAALAKSGLKPVFAVYSTFLQRGYDQLIHDAAIANLPLTLAVDRAGFVGDDGETHQGLFDVSFLSSIPNVKIYCPSTFNELKEMLKARLSSPEGIAAIRYPRGFEPKISDKPSFKSEFYDFYNNVEDICIVTYGTLIADAIKAANGLSRSGINVSVLKINILSPIDLSIINRLLNFKNIIFFEEGIKNGGVGERLGFMLLESGFKGNYKLNAVTDFVKQAPVLVQRQRNGLDINSMIKKVKEVIIIEQ